MNVTIGIGTAFNYARIEQFKIAAQKKIAPKKQDSVFESIFKRNDEALKAQNIERIKGKMKSGQRLSFQEKDFLRVHAPALYEKAIKIEEERDEHRRQLARCKTKEDVQKVQSGKALQLHTEAKSGAEDEETMQMRMMSIMVENAEFASSKEFQELPSEVEEEKDERKGKKAKRNLKGMPQNVLESYFKNMKHSFDKIKVLKTEQSQAAEAAQKN